MLYIYNMTDSPAGFACPAGPVPAVTRAIAILRLLGRSRTPMGVKAIAQALGLVPSTCLHILRALVSEQLVKVDAHQASTTAWASACLPWRAPSW